MTRVLVLYYSSYAHVETLATHVAEGASDHAEAVIRRVPELMPEDVARRAGVRLDQVAPIAEPDELPDYDAIVVGTPTRFGNMASQMRNFWDRTGGLWARGALAGKVGSVFTSTGTGSGSETTIISTHSTLIHHGMIVVGIAPDAAELADLSEMRAGSLYGAATLAGDGDREVSVMEASLARQQGSRVARIAAELRAGRSMEPRHAA